MSVSQTIKTRAGIKRFIFPSSEGDSSVLGFVYLDKKTEVHLLKHEGAPLYFEEGTSVTLLNSEHIGHYLLAVTPAVKQGKGSCLTFRVWDSGSILGFTPKEIQVSDADGSVTQDGKFRGQLNLTETVSDFACIKIDSLGSMLAMLVENEIIIWEMNKSDVGVVNLQYFDSIKLKGKQNYQEIILLNVNGVYSVSAFESGNITTWSLEKTGCSSPKTVFIPGKLNAVSTISANVQRLSQSRAILSDDAGYLWCFDVKTNSLKYIRLPGSPAATIASSFTYSSVQGKGLLATCCDGHTINLFHLSDSLVNSREFDLCERPFKVLFSNAPVTSIHCLDSDALAVASSSNRTLCFWIGLRSC